MKKSVLVVVVMTCALFGCKNTQEQNDLARAQRCLDMVPDSSYAQASQCMVYVQNYDDQQSDILKCAILDTAGGLTQTKIVSAYKLLSAGGQSNQTASFMTVLSLDNPDTTGYDTAVAADKFCQNSGVPGLMYISGLVVSGTYMVKTMDALGLTVDLTDATSVNNAVTSLIGSCGGASPDPACAADIDTLGNTVATIGQTYCQSPGADTTVCGQVDNAIQQAGGDPANVGQALFCYMNHKAFDPGSGGCL